ncbi:putative PurR-regulated permease PerM [Clostridium pascui]|uniref:AI-2E family transporter n=1 Tax=Clostridium pascui TaxID=46609 RepID=UPI001957D4D3|nr:AI-2E family transporter [Clostridium pascui]MBM7870817.1 putative PurR-regulated permease PerM [Clostridium pascui]
MFFNKNIKFKDILIFVITVVVGYIIIKNYNVFFTFITKFSSIISPFVYALIIAYCLNPLMNIFEKRLKFNRGSSITLTYITVLSLVILAFIYILPNIINSIISMTSEVPKYMQIVQRWINTALQNENLYDLIKDVGLLDYLSVLSSKFGSTLMTILEGSVSSIFSATASLVKVVLGFLIAIYVLLDKERLKRGAKILIYMLLKEERGNCLISWVKIYNKMIGLYIGTKAIDSAIIGTIALVGLLIMKAPYAGLLSLIVGVTNMVPYLGPLVGEIIGLFIGLFVSPMMAITMFLFLFVLQQFDAWYLDPKLIGESVGVKPFFIILSLTIGGGYFGIIGMLLASPTIATIKIYFDQKVAVFKSQNANLVKKYIDNKDQKSEDIKKISDNKNPKN